MMKKKVLSLLLIMILMLGLLIGLTACKAEDEEEEVGNASDPEELVEKYVGAISKGNAKKAISYVSPYGMYVFEDLYSYEYEDFWSKYKEFLKSDKYDDVKDDWEDEDKEDLIDELQDELDYMKENDYKISLKRITKVNEVGKNLYEVKLKVEMEYEYDKETSTIDGYIMKDGEDYYVVGGDLLIY